MTTTRLLILVLVGLILLAFASATHGAELGAAPVAVDRGPAAQSLVIIFSRSIDGTTCGNGFVVGDGSLIVTSRNVVFPPRPAGLHEGDAFVTVLSPQVGEAVEAQILAHDRALDLALLRVPWKSHPGLRLAEEADLLAAGMLELIAFTDAQSAVVAGRPSLLASASALVPRAVALDINAVMVRQNATQSIVTMAAPPGPGWAGSPMILPDTGALAGCYVRTHADGTAGAGTTCGAIRRLIDRAGASPALASAVPGGARAADADAATLAYLTGVSASAAGDAQRALAAFRQYLELRGSSAIGYRDAAGQLRAMKRVQDAQRHYEKALELDPSILSARVLYGQLLQECILPRAAEEHLSYAWQRGGAAATAAVLPLCNLLREQGRDRECLPLLSEAIDRRPYDAHLWNYLGQTNRALADPAAAGAAFARAADLTGDDAPLRLQAAQQFEAAGQRARAEAQYRALVEQHPDAATAHFHFARFLARDSGRTGEAVARAERALALSDAPGAPPRDVIRSLIAAIRAGRTSAASDLRL